MKLYLNIFLLIFSTICNGQKDSVRSLKQIIVTSTKIDASQIGKIILEIDSAKMYTQNFGTIQQLLSSNSNVFVKKYGSNNLSTLSVRGSNASQIATIWNGFNLNMLSQSQIDINLIPNFFIDKMAVEYGASASKNGSGAIGSTIHLQSHLPMHVGHIIDVNQQIASFQNYTTCGKYYFSNAKFASSTKIFLADALNNYSFYPNGSKLFAKEKLTNNKMNQFGILQENKILINNKHTLVSGIWWQNTYRQLPPSITSANTLETQTDNHTRVYLHLNGSYDKYLHNAKIMASQEYLHYINPAIGINDDYETKRVMLESEHIYTNKIGIFSAIAQYNFGQMKSDKYITNAFQNRMSIHFGFAKIMLRNKLQTAISARQEWISQHQIPITYSANASYQISNSIKLNAVINSMYRIPTFNDLFWAGTGNPNLKSEKGIGADIGIFYHISTKQNDAWIASNNKSLNNLEIGITSFTRNVNNWIIWTPNTSNIWRPQNILEVWSRGIEVTAHYQTNIKNIVFAADLNYAFTKSTNQQVNNAMINAYQKQLIYTPIQIANSNISFSYQNWQAIYQYQFVGKRFITSDNENELPSFGLQNLQIRKLLHKNKHNCTVGAGINNVFNQNYQVIAFRAMPLRNYFLSLQIQILPNNKSKKIN